MGLGFSFAAKDKGLGRRLNKYIGLMDSFRDSYMGVNKAAQQSGPSMEGMTQAMDPKKVDKGADAVGKLNDAVGERLPRATRRASSGWSKWTKGFVRDSSDVERKGIRLIKDAVETLGKILTQSKLQTWIESISLSRLGDIAEGIEKIGTEGINLTTSLEATMTSNAKSTKAMAANFGLAGKAAKDFTGKAAGMAYGMNIGTDVAGKAVYAFKTWGKALKAVGIDSEETAAKMGEVFGIDMSAFAQQLNQMQQEFGLTDAELNNVVGSFTAFGKQSGNVSGALEMMPQIIENMREQAHALGIEMSSTDLAGFATDTASLATGFYAVTGNMEDARDQAMALGKALIAARADMGKLFAGTADDIPQMATELGIATGDISKAFGLMQEGPAGFTQGIAQMVQQAKKEGKKPAEVFNFLHQRLVEAVGPEQANMLQSFFEKADDSTIQMMASTKGATASLGKMAKEGFSSGLTLQDSFERTQQAFITRFRSIARKEAVAFVKDTGQEFNKFSDHLKGIAAEGGPLGAITKKFAEMHQMGALALLPKTLRPMAAVFGTMLKEVTPLIGMMGSLGLRFAHLGLLAPVAALGALVWSFKAAEQAAVDEAKALSTSEKAMRKQEGAIKALKAERDKLAGGTAEARKLDLKIAKETQQLDLARYYKTLTVAQAALSKERKRGKPDLERVAQLEAQVATSQVKVAAATGDLTKTQRELSKIQFAETTKKVVNKVGLFFAAIPSIFKTAFNTIREMWPEIGPPIMEALKKAWIWVKGTAWPFIKDFVRGIWNGIVTGSKAEEGSTAQKLGSAIGSALRHGFDYAIAAIKGYIKSWWAKMGSIWGDGSLSFTEKVKATFQNSGGIILAAFALARFTPVFGVLGRLTSILGSVLAPAAKYAAKGVWKAGGMMVESLAAVGTAGFRAATTASSMGARWAVFSGSLANSFPILSQVLGAIFSVTGAIVGAIAVVGALTIGFLAWPEKTKQVVDKVTGYIRTGFAKITGFVLEALFQIAKYTILLPVTILANFNKILGAIGQALKGALGFIQAAIMGVLDGIETWLTGKFPKMANLIHTVFAILKFTVEAVFAVIRVGVDIVIGILKVLWTVLDTLIIQPLVFLGEVVVWLIVKAFEGWSAIIGVVGDGLSWLGDQIGSALDAVGGAVGGVVDDLGDLWSGAVDAVAGITGVNKVMEATARASTKAVTVQTAAQRAAAAEAAKFAEADRAYAAWEKQADTAHQAEMDKLKTKYTEVGVTAENYHARAQSAADSAAKGINQSYILVDKTARSVSKIVPPKFDQEFSKAAEEYKKLSAEFEKAKPGKEADKVVAKMDELRAATAKAQGVTAGFLANLQAYQEKNFVMADALREKMTLGEQRAYQDRLDLISNSMAKERVEIEKNIIAWREANQQKLANLKADEATALAGVKGMDFAAYQQRLAIKQKFHTDQLALESEYQRGWEGFVKQTVALDQKALDEKLAMEHFSQISRVSLIERLNSGEISGEADKLNAIAALNQKFTGEMATAQEAAVKRAPALAQWAADASLEINNAYFDKLQLASKIKDDAQRAAAFAAAEQFRADQSAIFKKTLDEQAALVAANQGKISTGSQQALDTVKTNATAAAEATAAALPAALDKSLKAEDLGAALKLGKLDPKKFSESLSTIQQAFNSFTANAALQTQAFLDTTTAAFATFDANSVAFWEKQRVNVVSLFVFKAEDSAQITDSLGKMVEAGLAAFVTALSATVEKIFFDMFARVFTKSMTDTKKFIKDVSKEFCAFAKAISGEFKKAWDGVLTQTAESVQAIEAKVTSTTAQLSKLTAALDANAAAQTIVAKGKAKDITKLGAEERDQELLNATNMPLWAEFQRAQMSDLIAATKANAATGVQGGRVTKPGSTEGKPNPGTP